MKHLAAAHSKLLPLLEEDQVLSPMLLSSLLSRVLEDVVFESLENPEELLEDEVQRAACMSWHRSYVHSSVSSFCPRRKSG